MARSLILSALLLLASPLYAADLVIGTFSGLNTTDNPATLADGESQDLLNVNIEAGGKSVKKREGYGLYKNLPVNTSTTPVRGGYHFQDAAGNDIQLWGNDSKITAIVGGATPVVIATMTLGSTLQCTDSQGNAYCFTSGRDTRIITNGTTSGTTYNSNIASGTMGAFTPTRLVVAGISGAANTLYFSRANTFNNFTIGTTDADAWTEPIASPGSRITHIRYACGKLLWWKDQSFGWLIGETQSDVTVNIIQGDIGTLDNSSAYYNNTVWFRGQDNHIYQYDCANLTRLSSSITPTVETAGRRKANSWTQTSQADFSGGGYSFHSSTPAVSTSAFAGSVVLSTHSASDTSNSDFSNGTFVGIDTTTISGGITLSAITEGFDSGTGVFTSTTSATYCPDAVDNDGAGHLGNASPAGNACAFKEISLSSMSAYVRSKIEFDVITSAIELHICQGGIGGPGYALVILRNAQIYLFKTTQCDDGTTIDHATQIGAWSATYSGFGTYDTVAYSNVRGTFTVYFNGSSLPSTVYDATYSSFTLVLLKIGAAVSYDTPHIDDVVVGQGYGNFTSRLFDTKTSSPAYGIASFGTNNIGSYDYSYICSSASVGGFNQYTSISNGGVPSSCHNKRYIRYSSTMSVSLDGTSHFPVISSATFVYSSTGTYYSAVNNSPSLSSWDIFTADDTLGDGTITYYTRSSTSSFTVGSSTPTWIAQSKNAQVTASTGTYFQARADFGITSATQTPTLNDFTFNWYEGSAGDKAYIEYFDDHVWVAVASGASTSNNKIQRWDTANSTWLLDDIPAGGLVVDQNRLYIGDPVNGKVYRFGDVYTDNSASFESYWKSKDYVGGDPFVQNEWVQHDWLVDVSTGTLTVSYQVDASTITSYTINLYDPTAGVLRRSRNLPPGKIGTFYNVKIGNTSDQSWEVFGHRSKYTPLPWRPN